MLNEKHHESLSWKGDYIVNCILEDGRKEYNSIAEACREIGISKKTLIKYCKDPSRKLLPEHEGRIFCRKVKKIIFSIQKGIDFMLEILKYSLLLMTFVSAIAQSPDYNTNSIENLEIVNKGDSQKKISNYNHDLIKEFFIDIVQIELLELVVFSMTTIAHELGHAIAAKSLFESQKPIQIHIGTRTPETIFKLFSLKNMHFYKTIPWVRGATELNRLLKEDQPLYNKIGLGIIFSAGGVSGAGLMYFLLSAITAYCAYCDNKGLFEITLKSFVNGISPFSYILKTENLLYKQKRFLLNVTLVICLSFIYQFFYSCTPYRNIGDGITIWEKFAGVTGAKLKVVQVLSTLGVWSSWIFLIKKYCDARKQLSEKDSQVSITAAISSMFLMYLQLVR